MPLNCAAVQGVGIVGLELEGLVEIGDRLVILLPLGLGKAAAGVSPGVPRVELEHSRKVVDRFAELFLVSPGVAANAVCVGVLGIEPDGLVEIGDGLVVLPLIAARSGRGRYMPPRLSGRGEWLA